MNPLADLLPTTARKLVYALASLASFALGVWEATNGNWNLFAAGIVGGLVSALAHNNTPTAEQSDPTATQPLRAGPADLTGSVPVNTTDPAPTDSKGI